MTQQPKRVTSVESLALSLETVMDLPRILFLPSKFCKKLYYVNTYSFVTASSANVTLSMPPLTASDVAEVS